MESFDAPGLYAPALLPPSFQAVQTVTQLRMASAAYLSAAADVPPDTAWTPRIYGDIELTQSAFDAFGIGGRIALGLGDVEVTNADRALDAMVDSGVADGRDVTIRVVNVTTPRASDFGSTLSDAPVAFRGVVRRVDPAPFHRARLSIADIGDRLATPLQAARFLGTGGLEGPASLEGRPKPVALGQVTNVSPVSLGSINLGVGALPTYAVHYRAVQAITAVRIRGVAQVSSGGTPTVGQFRAFASSGVFQLGSAPDGIVTADVQGDAVPTYVSSIGGMLRRLVQALGPQFSDAQIQDEAFAFADGDLPGAMGWYRGADETTAAEAVEAILAGCGAVLCGGRGGTIRLFDPLNAGGRQFALPEAHILQITPLALPAALRPLPAAVAVAWARNWTIMQDFAGSVTDDDKAAYGSTSRGPARVTSSDIAFRVLHQRDLRFNGLYASETDAEARATRWVEFFEATPRFFQVTTDRYLGQIECGDVGVIAYPAHGLEAGVGVVVLGWAEALAGRRLTLTLATVPWVTVPPLVTGGDGLDYFILDVDEVA
jgi:hypothetical protein